ncbi:MAG: formylmethanofuran--tetrahydromethanopterin N-formyltransferase [Promethearchaeota archaeon]|nr:MAG: formylmethanofuran--tetrahydromethanopterin N-formyltransferase [Candidatus Lokiarchaeota archaeon]
MVKIIYEEFAEVFDGTVVQILATAKNQKLLERAAYSFAALPSTVFGDAEGGIVRWVSPEETIDNRPGVILQLWVTGTGKKAQDNLYDKLGRRMRQGILVVPTTAVFNSLEPENKSLESENKFEMMNNVGHCGDGFEKIVEKYDRELISVPIMMGYDFLVERYLNFTDGIMGGNLWFFCDSVDSGLEAGEIAVETILNIDGAITAFNICSAGSKVETNYPEIGPTTNHWYCPTLRNEIKDSEVPKDVKSIPEIVINGISIEVVKKAMKEAAEAVQDVKGLKIISAGNFGGKLGSHKIYLEDVLK